MSEYDIEVTLRRFSTAPKSLLSGFREGIHLTSVTARTLDDLRNQVCADRLSLAAGFVETGDNILSFSQPDFRSAIGRYYYGMYQTMRALVYFDNDGDDHEAHSELPKHVPTNLRDAAVWRNRLKDARQRRNDADYEPYPQDINQFEDIAIEMQTFAHSLLAVAQSYLRARGCDQI